MFQFGSGFLFGNPVGGNLAPDPTPKQFGTLQDVSFDISQTLKELRGNLKFPDDVAPSDMKITGKAKFGRIDVALFNQLFFAETPSAGIEVITPNEADQIPSSTAYTITVANASGGSPVVTQFSTDLGVIYAATGARFTRIPSGTPDVGEYTVSDGTYTFASADASTKVLISYSWIPSTNTAGTTVTVTNRPQGYGPVTELWLAEPYQGNNGAHLYAVRFSKLSAPLKRDDYQLAEMDFEAFANPAGNVMDFYQISA